MTLSSSRCSCRLDRPTGVALRLRKNRGHLPAAERARPTSRLSLPATCASPGLPVVFHDRSQGCPVPARHLGGFNVRTARPPESVCCPTFPQTGSPVLLTKHPDLRCTGCEGYTVHSQSQCQVSQMDPLPGLGDLVTYTISGVTL